MSKLFKSIKEVPGFSTAIDTQHLAMSMLNKPHDLGMLVSELYAQTYVNEYPLYSSLINKSNIEEKDGASSWPEVSVKYPNAGYQIIVIEGDAMAGGTGKYGLGKTDVFVWTTEPLLVPSDEISPGNPLYQLRIQSHAEKKGSGWLYRAMPKFTSNTETIPVKYFTKGSKWTKLWASAEEGNQQKGSTWFPGRPLSTTIKGGKINKHFKMTDFALYNDPNQHCEVMLGKNVMGKKVMAKTILTWAEHYANKQWMKEKNRYCWFSRDAVVAGSTNRMVAYATGFYWQIMDNGFAMGYQKITAKLIYEFFNNIHQPRIGYTPGDIDLYAGSYAIEQFNDAFWADLASFGLQINSDKVLRNTTSELSGAALEFGAMVTSIRLKNNKIVRIHHEPTFDDPELFTEIDPVSGRLISSGTIVAMDVSGMGKNSTTRLIVPKGGMEYMSYRVGNVPMSLINQSTNGYVATSEDAFEVNYTANMLPFIDDPTRTGVLYLDR